MAVAARQEATLLKAGNLPGPLASPLTINELILRSLQFAATYYVKNGRVAKECEDLRYSLRPLRKLYGRSLVCEFGPLPYFVWVSIAMVLQLSFTAMNW